MGTTETTTVRTRPAYFSQEYTEAKEIKLIAIEFTPEIKQKIVAAYNLLIQHDFSCIEIPIVAILESEPAEEVEWRESCECIKLHKGFKSLCYYAQSHYDSSDQIESEDISFETLGINI